MACLLTCIKPGTGKSVLLRGKSRKNQETQCSSFSCLLAIIEKLKSIYGTGVAVTASTGIAACNISGCTLHRCGINLHCDKEQITHLPV